MIPISKEEYFLWHPWTDMSTFFNWGVIFTDGEGCILKDVDGKEYINGLGSLWCLHLGLKRKEIIEAITKQLSALAFVPLIRSAHLPAIKLSEKLIKIVPQGLTKVVFTVSGSDSIETAIKIVRQYNKIKNQTNKYKIVCLKLSYHGVSYGAMSASGDFEDHKRFSPIVPGFIHIPPPYCYRCEFELEYPHCKLKCALELERIILQEGPETVAAFLMEPILGGAGIIVPPKEYFDIVRQVCKKYDIFFIVDEVTTGFGRCGKMFASELWGLKPDILCLGKGINSGYLPLGCILCTEEIYKTFVESKTILAHGSTLSGCPASCAAAIATIEVIQRENLVENSRKVGAYLLKKLNEELIDHPNIGQIRGIGLMIGIEVVANKETKEKLPREKQAVLLYSLFREGLILYSLLISTFSFFPPLTFTYELADKSIEILKKCFGRIKFM